MVGLFSLKNFSWLNRFIPVNGARFLLQERKRILGRYKCVILHK
ncbi:hypothetical protein AR684_13755 [Enterococcus faecalis]|nr:hypothetical protein AR684_13755 [Enterococcus faecalis]